MIKGKALLVMDRIAAHNPKEFQWDIHVIELSCSSHDPGGEVQENFSCVEYDIHPAPAPAYKMAIGDRLRILVHYELHYTRGDGWLTDDDVDLYYERVKVLRRQPYSDKRFRKLHYEHWRDTQ